MPFCRDHASKLPKAHKEKLWTARRPGSCGACDIADWHVTKEGMFWLGLYDLALSILLELDHDGCGAPEAMRDDNGFCWTCGIADAVYNEQLAKKVIEKYELR
jgi:hypothetical protein